MVRIVNSEGKELEVPDQEARRYLERGWMLAGQVVEPDAQETVTLEQAPDDEPDDDYPDDPTVVPDDADS